MLGSGSAGNSALVATDHCKILVDGGLSARQLVLRLEQCGVMPERLDGILLTHEHGDHICGLEVLCRKFDVPIYCNALTAEAARCDSSFRATPQLANLCDWFRVFDLRYHRAHIPRSA
jgi:phosphoribosyl 1,2-cyclic phosphodiesterase